MSAALITIWFDYACPHSYIGLGQLEELASNLDIKIDRRPFLTRSDSLTGGRIQGNNVDPVGDGVRRQPLYEPGHGLITEPASNRSVSTLLVHAATACAKEKGLDGPFYQVASKDYWEKGTDLANLYTLRRVCMLVGLDWDEVWPKLGSGDYHDLVIAQHQEAAKAGIVQTPSYQIGERLHSGPIDVEELRVAVQAAK